MTHNNTRALIALNEGRRKFPYADTTGHVTIGIGRNLTDVGLFDDEIDLLFANDVARTQADLDKHLPWVNDLDQARYAAILDMCFNLGVGGLMKFTRSLKFLKDRDYDAAADNFARSLWYKQVKSRGPRIVNMIRTGEWPTEVRG